MGTSHSILERLLRFANVGTVGRELPWVANPATPAIGSDCRGHSLKALAIGFVAAILAACGTSSTPLSPVNAFAPARWSCLANIQILVDAGTRLVWTDAGPNPVCVAEAAPVCVGLWLPMPFSDVLSTFRCHWTDEPPSPTVYQWEMFYNTTCDPEDAGSCAAQVHDVCVYDDPFDGGYTLTRAFRRNRGRRGHPLRQSLRLGMGGNLDGSEVSLMPNLRRTTRLRSTCIHRRCTW